MTGVMAALEADDHIRRDAEPVDDLAFSLVAPLGADHNDVRHFLTRAGICEARADAGPATSFAPAYAKPEAE